MISAASRALRGEERVVEALCRDDHQRGVVTEGAADHVCRGALVSDRRASRGAVENR